MRRVDEGRGNGFLGFKYFFINGFLDLDLLGFVSSYGTWNCRDLQCLVHGEEGMKGARRE